MLVDFSHPIGRLANVRDLGGIPIGSRVIASAAIFRSDDISTIDAAQADDLDGLGLRLIIDLRSAAETQASGRGPMLNKPARYLNLALADVSRASAKDPKQPFSNRDLGLWYAQLLQTSAPAILLGLEAIAAESGPVLFHCAAGKDRTGVFATALLSILGASERVIKDEYALTQQNMPAVLARLAAGRKDIDSRRFELLGAIIRADEEAKQVMLEQVRESHGGVLNALRTFGLEAATEAALKSRLLAAKEY